MCIRDRPPRPALLALHSRAERRVPPSPAQATLHPGDGNLRESSRPNRPHLRLPLPHPLQQ
eukprot:5732521-Alexandrium_andersonii.AAC.1